MKSILLLLSFVAAYAFSSDFEKAKHEKSMLAHYFKQEAELLENDIAYTEKQIEDKSDALKASPKEAIYLKTDIEQLNIRLYYLKKRLEHTLSTLAQYQ